jgi:hypothetical protein
MKCFPSLSPMMRRGIAVAIALLVLLPRQAAAASLSPEELGILGKSLSFLQPAPAGEAIVAIVYAAGDPGSQQDARAIAAAIGDGLVARGAVFRPKLVDVAALASVEFALIVVAANANDEAVMRAAQRRHVLCVTADREAVHAGTCIMAIRSEPRVGILLNSQAARGAGIAFATAFRMMVQEQ